MCKANDSFLSSDLDEMHTLALFLQHGESKKFSYDLKGICCLESQKLDKWRPSSGIAVVAFDEAAFCNTTFRVSVELDGNSSSLLRRIEHVQA